MTRFAVTVTAMELILTLFASIWIVGGESNEPYLKEDEFGMLGIPVEKYLTERRSRFGALFSYETQGQVKGGGASITLSVRVNTPRSEFDARLSGERFPKLRAGDEAPLVNDESWPEEPGYVVRQVGRNGARAEVVRLRGTTMLIVRAIQLDVQGNVARANTARCERLARLVQEHMAQKLGWREEAPK